MPCRLNGDVHEWLNDVVTVPNSGLPKSLTGEQTGIAKWEAKTLQTFTTTCRCEFIISAQSKWERRSISFG